MYISKPKFSKTNTKTIFKPLVMELRNTFLLYHMLIFIQNEPKNIISHFGERREITDSMLAK